jgi:hypothetical protein
VCARTFAPVQRFGLGIPWHLCSSAPPQGHMGGHDGSPVIASMCCMAAFSAWQEIAALDSIGAVHGNYAIPVFIMKLSALRVCWIDKYGAHDTVSTHRITHHRLQELTVVMIGPFMRTACAPAALTEIMGNLLFGWYGRTQGALVFPPVGGILLPRSSSGVGCSGYLLFHRHSPQRPRLLAGSCAALCFTPFSLHCCLLLCCWTSHA